LYHTLAALISGSGFFPLTYDYHAIKDDLPDFDNSNVDEHFGLQSLSLRHSSVFKPKNGFKCMVSCFVPPNAVKLSLGRVDYLLYAMTRLERFKTRPLSFMTLLLMLAQIRKSPMFDFMMPMPIHYYSVFKKLDIKGPILDLFPGFGAKFIAAKALGIDYYTLNKKAINYASAQGIEDLLGGPMKLYDGRHVEWLIYDNDMSVRNRELPSEFLTRTNHLMRFDRRNNFTASYKIPISWNKYTGSAIYLAVD